MELLEGLALVAGSALGVFIAGSVVLALWLRNAGKPLLLQQVLARQGEGVAERARKNDARDFGVAVERCLGCTQAAQCQAWLWSGARDGYQRFCPNAKFIERMRQ